jgi:hypothetical protein
LWTTANDNYPKDGSNTDPTYALAQVGGTYSFRTISTPATGTAAAKWIRFDSANNCQIGASDSISVVSVHPLAGDGSRIIGTGAQLTAPTTAATLASGVAVPIYGLYEICDFSKRSFPRTVTLYSGRLALGGFPDSPLRIAVSNVLDSSVPGTYYNNYQTLLEPVSTSNALYFELNGNADDAVTALAEFQNQLFAFCRKGIYRISGTDSGSITPTAFSVSFVAFIGCVNAQSVVKVDKTIYFLSQSGMYDIVPTIEAGDFTAGERSLKIKNMFNKTSSVLTEQASWVEYDPVFQEVYVAIPDTNYEASGCSRLLVYSILRDSWTEYTFGMRGRWWSIGGFVSVNGLAQGRDVVVITLAKGANDAVVNPVPLLLDGDRYLDGVLTSQIVSGGADFNTGKSSTAAPTTLVSPMWRDITITHTVDSRVMEYPVKSNFDLMPTPSVVDCEVFLNDVKLTHGIEWQKTPRSSIMLLKVFTSGSTLTIRKLDSTGNPALAVYVDNVKQTYGTDYTISPNSTTVNFLTFLPVGAVVTTGIVYESWHYTPLMTLETLDVDKRFMRYIGYYRNVELQATFDTKDVNSVTNQDITAIVSVPKNRADVSVAFLYQDNEDGYISTDLYNYPDLYWDVALLDITPSALQYQPSTRIVENLLGLSYGVQVVNFCRSDGAFELSGYQIVARGGGRHSRHWST